MKLLLCALLALLPAGRTQRLPSLLVGTWKIGKPFNTPGPIGINAKKDELILSLHLTYSRDHLHVCGKDVPTELLAVKLITTDDFLQAEGFTPDVIGLGTPSITEVTLDRSHPVNACDLHGVAVAPGTHVFMDQKGHTVMEVGNAYYALKKR